MKYFRIKRTAKTNTFWPWCWLYNGFFIKKNCFFVLPSIFFCLCSAKKVKGAWTPWFHPPYLVLIIVITLATNRVWVFEYWWNCIFFLRELRDFGSYFYKLTRNLLCTIFSIKKRNGRKLARSIYLTWKL